MNNETNKLIGQSFTAMPDANSPWVTTSDGDNEKDYYRDVYDIDLNTGNRVAVYMYGESCTVQEVDNNIKMIKLVNEDYLFEISFEQFSKDFQVQL